MRMKRWKRNRKHIDNRGISLVEVVVAFTILAIVSGSMLHAFVTSTKFNMKAKEQQRMTTAAQSVMEGLKALDVEELCRQFNGVHPFTVYSAVTNRWEIDLDGDGATSIRTVSGVQEFVPSAVNRYAFAMQDIAYEGKYYDAKVELEPKGAGVDVYYTEDMNGYCDAVYRQASELDATVYSLILQNVLDKLNEKDEFYEYELAHLDKTKITIDKVTTVAITESGAVQNVLVECSYAYKVTDYPYYDAMGTECLWSSETDEPFLPLTYSYTIYDNSTTSADGAQLANVYIYYYPAYSSTIGGAPIDSETINIQNATSSVKKVYLIKQKRSVSNLLTLENSYLPVINGSGDIALYHNLTTNLADPSGACGTVSFSGFGITPSTELLQKKTEILLYSVKISIYEQGEAAVGFTAEPLLILDGSINGK